MSTFIFTKELTQEEYDALKEKSIKCNTHGSGRMALVCQHLLNGRKRGFHEVVESSPLIEPEDDYQAWCDRCEEAWEKEGELNEAFKKFCQIKLVCDQCYFEIKRKNILEDQ